MKRNYYYEEDIVDGSLQYRKPPHGKWRKVPHEELTRRLIEADPSVADGKVIYATGLSYTTRRIR